MIRKGYNAELDELHDIAENNNAWMQDFELRIKEETGIKNLKVGFNKVFGYYIEVSKGRFPKCRIALSASRPWSMGNVILFRN